MSALEAIQEWYQQQCNGEWEHRYGVKIETLDNPGWRVTIDLTGTTLADKYFEPIQNGTDAEGWQQSDQWINCCVRDSIWQGAGDATKLDAILTTFLNWAHPS